LPSVDFDKFNKYSYLFDESKYLPDFQPVQKMSPIKKEFAQQNLTMIVNYDPISSIGDPVAYSRSNARRAEIMRSKARGGDDELTIGEKEKLRQMI